VINPASWITGPLHLKKLNKKITIGNENLKSNTPCLPADLPGQITERKIAIFKVFPESGGKKC
jgi:hypothetical protein